MGAPGLLLVVAVSRDAGVALLAVITLRRLAEQIVRGEDARRLAPCGALRTRNGSALGDQTLGWNDRRHDYRERAHRAGGNECRRRNHDEQRDEPRRNREQARYRAPVPTVIENREQAIGQLRTASHADGCQRRRARHTEIARNLEEMRRVFGWPRSRQDDRVITGTLALAAQRARREPHERIEPVECAGGLRDELRETI